MTLSDVPTKNGAEPIRGEEVRRLSCSERGIEVARCQSKVRMEEKRMKQSFDKLDIFCRSINALAKFHCNEQDAYDKGEAVAMLQQLTREWRCNETYAILTVAQLAQSDIDIQLCNLAYEVIYELQMQITKEEFIERWKNFRQEEKLKLVDTIILLLNEIKREG